MESESIHCTKNGNNSKQVTQVDNDCDNGKDWPQVLTLFIVTLAPLTNGIIFCWSSPFILGITKDKENYDVSEDEASYFAVIPPIGMIIFSFVFYKINDMIGRKYTLLILIIPHLTFWILTIVARKAYMFYIARFIGGIGDAIVFCSLPMYIGEITSPKVRGTWGNLLPFTLYFGQFLINVIGSYFDVLQTAYICMGIPILFSVLFFFMPESPYFLIMKGNYEQARTSLKFLRRKENVHEDLEQMKADVKRQMSESGKWKDLFVIKSNRKALIAAIFLRISQQFAGYAIFATYTQLIFEKSGGNINPQTSSMIFTGLFCFLNVIAGFLANKMGRVKSYFYSVLLSGIVLFFLSVYFYIDQFEDSIDVTFLNWIPITGMILYIIFYSFGVGIVPTMMLGELFSASIKVKGTCAVSVVFGISVCVTTNLFHLLNTYAGLFCPFLLLACCCFISAGITIYLVPETKGKTLEEIQQSLKAPKKKNKKETKKQDI